MKRLTPTLILVLLLALTINGLMFLLSSTPIVADSAANNVAAHFRTAWFYDSPEDTFTNGQVTGRKWWQVGIRNLPDETGAPITALSLSLESNLVFAFFNAENMVTTGPPTYEWSFGDVPEGDYADVWVDSLHASKQSMGTVSVPVTFTPGFDASRSADKTEFSAPDTQTLTITLTPREVTEGFGIHVQAIENNVVDSVITSPASGDGIRLSQDGHSLHIDLTGPELNNTYTTTVTIQVTPKVPEVTFIPQVTVMEWDKIVASGSDSGSFISYPVGDSKDEAGTWTWRTQDSCLWQWQEGLSRRVNFNARSYGPQGQGTGTPSVGPAPAFGWRFDSGLAIGLVVISPALYFAGRRFRKKDKSVDLTKIVYPLIIALTGWYLVANMYHIIADPSWYPGVSALVWAVLWPTILIIAFSYALIRKIKLEFKWSALSVVGFVFVAYFLVVAISEFLNPVIPKFNYFFTGIWDHTFFPIAFGLLALCDLNKMPKTFWLILLPVALPHLTILINSISILLSDTYVFDVAPGTPSLSMYFGVESKAQLLAIPQDRLIIPLIIYLRELFSFMLLLPAMVCYYLSKSLFSLVKRRRKSSPTQL